MDPIRLTVVLEIDPQALTDEALTNAFPGGGMAVALPGFRVGDAAATCLTHINDDYEGMGMTD